MSTKTGTIVGGIAYVALLLVAIICKVIFVKDGLGGDISLGILMISTIAVAIVVFGTDLVVADPMQQTAAGGTSPPLSDEEKYKLKKERSYWVLMHVLLFAAVAVLPFEEAPRISCLVIFTLLVIALATVGAKDYTAYKQYETDSMVKIAAMGEKALPFLVAALLIIAIWQKFDGKGFFTALYSRVQQEVADRESSRSSVRRADAPNWSEMFLKSPSGRPAPMDDPLAGEQKVTLHQAPPAPSSPLPVATPASPNVHPEFIATVSFMRRPLELSLGRTDGLYLSPDSYIDVTTPGDAVYVRLLASLTGAGADVYLDRGVLTQSNTEYICKGSWRQGATRGSYTMNIQEAGATAHLFVSGEEVCQLSIVRR